MLHQVLRSLKRTLLPRGKRFRTLPFGPARGSIVSIDLQRQLRQYLGFYERELDGHFRSLVRPGDRCFDVGGHSGYDALLLARLSGGEVVSFECEAGAAGEMREVFRRNPSLRVALVEAFVGDVEGPGHITLDRAASAFFVPDFIKIDVEGAEAAVLQGARETLARRQPALIIEVHGREVEGRCLSILNEHGYEPRIVDRRGWLAEHRPIEHNRWLVCARPA